MLIDAPRDALDLLVVGGLTIDHFADGSAAPGGSVVHVARAAASAGVRLGIVTAAGPEPEALAALDELRGLAAVLEATSGSTTIRYRHVESAAGRRLWLETAGAQVTWTADAPARLQARATLFAPVAGEIGTDLLVDLSSGLRGAILQGWLRTTVPGEVGPVPLSGLTPRLTESLAAMRLLTASREDLRSEADEPAAQLAAVRALVGRGPILIVTDGADGAWIDDGAEVQHWPVPRRVEGVSSVGAGDVLAACALLALGLPGATAQTAALAGMRAVIEMLEARGA